MKKALQILSLFIVTIIFTCVLSSCISEEDIIGEWTHTWEMYDGTECVKIAKFKIGGFYLEDTYKDGKKSASWTGMYEIRGNKIYVSVRAGGKYVDVSIPYVYENGKMTSGNSTYYKTK